MQSAKPQIFFTIKDKVFWAKKLFFTSEYRKIFPGRPLLFWELGKHLSDHDESSFITSGKLWLKMRRMSIISLVLHFFGSSLSLTRRMDLIWRALDTPDVVDYFSYPQYGQEEREKVLEAFEVKKFTQSST